MVAAGSKTFPQEALLPSASETSGPYNLTHRIMTPQ